MPMPREYTIIMRDLVENETLDPKEVLFSLLNWLPEDDVYEFSQDEYDVATNAEYKAKYDALDASNEEVGNDDWMLTNILKLEISYHVTTTIMD